MPHPECMALPYLTDRLQHVPEFTEAIKMEYVFSNKIRSLAPSAIREILKATADPSIIPLAAGNPAPEAFPVDAVREITKEILDTRPIEALQYGVTEGYTPLREKVREWVKARENIGTEKDTLLIVSGATQVMDLMTKVLCNEGDTVICEDPSFIGSLNCFRSYGCKLCGVPVEADGMDVNALEEALKKEKNVKFIYTIPNFQNPSGATMSLAKRQKLYALAKEYDVMILEDNPYGELIVEGEKLPCIKSMDTDGIVVYAGSFSKILSPGLRVAYTLAPAPVAAKMTVGKQASDVHTPVLNQMIVDTWLRRCDTGAHIEKLRAIYRKKRDLMCGEIDKHLGGFVTYVRPAGGLFVWCSLPEDVDMLDFVQKGVEHGVAVVPGNAFLTDDKMVSHEIRLNFSTPTDEKIVEGVRALGETAKLFQ